MFLTAVEYLREGTDEKKADQTLTPNKLVITGGQHVQAVQCIKVKEASTKEEGAEAEAAALSYQLTQEGETAGKWLLRFKFFGNVFYL